MKKLILAAPLALAAGLLATPASAAPWNDARQIRAEINQLDRQVDRARGLSAREEQRLGSQVDRLQALYSRYARNGFTRGELSLLDTRIDMVRRQLLNETNNAKARNDRDGRHDRNVWRDHR